MSRTERTEIMSSGILVHRTQSGGLIRLPWSDRGRSKLGSEISQTLTAVVFWDQRTGVGQNVGIEVAEGGLCRSRSACRLHTRRLCLGHGAGRAHCGSAVRSDVAHLPRARFCS